METVNDILHWSQDDGKSEKFVTISLRDIEDLPQIQKGCAMFHKKVLT